MHREIGSEFWKVEVNQECKPITESFYEFLLTGRTALDYLIKDIKQQKELKSVYMPTYCCHTMIQPFLDNGVNVEFYDVSFESGRYTYEIDFETRCDAVLIMQYFGYCNKTVGRVINRFKERGRIIIEDATHSWFSESSYNYKSDYVFASFRKWTGLSCGAIVIKRYDSFYVSFPSLTNYRYIEMRQKAATLKQQYIEKGDGQKEVFLRCFNEAERTLEIDYKNYKVPKNIQYAIKRLDAEKIKRKRVLNAKYLNKRLKNYSGIKTIIQTDRDVPLFIPIIVLDGKRDKLRQFLIKNDVYCPVHWILSKDHKIKRTYLYDNGLSLVCDQRYSISDMERTVNIIDAFYGG